jgi:hypothetical protein
MTGRPVTTRMVVKTLKIEVRIHGPHVSGGYSGAELSQKGISALDPGKLKGI